MARLIRETTRTFKFLAFLDIVCVFFAVFFFISAILEGFPNDLIIPSWQIYLFIFLLGLTSLFSFMCKMMECDRGISFAAYSVLSFIFFIMIYYTPLFLEFAKSYWTFWSVGILVVLSIVLGIRALVKEYTTSFCTGFFVSFWSSIAFYFYYEKLSILQSLIMSIQSWWLCLMIAIVFRFILQSRLIYSYEVVSHSLDDWILPNYYNRNIHDDTKEEQKNSWIDTIEDEKPYAYHSASEALRKQKDSGTVNNTGEFHDKTKSDSMKDTGEVDG
ncbi:hypothetical protein [Gracilibacillus sp. YIM 98692]|uniref:hypothetical protein n=1 Tax=Gracilibacillus sp. YIM 98692 TaxID=2663532 RepID=UPI0013CFECD9|nr:hypothetical protein [Gracilibacillus sp. YIM 98692]